MFCHWSELKWHINSQTHGPCQYTNMLHCSLKESSFLSMLSKMKDIRNAAVCSHLELFDPTLRINKDSVAWRGLAWRTAGVKNRSRQQFFYERVSLYILQTNLMIYLCVPACEIYITIAPTIYFSFREVTDNTFQLFYKVSIHNYVSMYWCWTPGVQNHSHRTYLK